MAKTVTARGRNARVSRRGDRVVITPTWWAWLRGARSIRFRVADVRTVWWHPAGWWRPGWVTFDLGHEPKPADADDPCTVVYPYHRRGEFDVLIATAGGQPPAPDPHLTHTTRSSVHCGRKPLVRAITIRPPWTVPILTGAKTVENRRHNTHHRGLLAIHVSRTWCPAGAADARVQAATGPDTIGDRHGLHRLALTGGAVVAVAELVDCHRATTELVDCSEATGCCPPWGEPDCWHLVLAHVTPLQWPIPARGNLAVWTLPAAVADAVTGALPVELDATTLGVGRG